MIRGYRTILCLLFATSTVFSLTAEDLEKLVTSLKGDDYRIFRWNATPHTVERQQAGDCGQLVAAAQLLLDAKSSIEAKKAAAEYATFCITDNPTNRAAFGEVAGIHKAVIDLVASDEDYRLSSLAAHLIYIATYANAKNHLAFQEQGALAGLAKLVMHENSVPVEKMWAAAALQNLAASYCDTPGDGTCYWEWTATEEHIQLSPASPLISDGSSFRKAMFELEGLVDALIELSCQGPVNEEEEGVVTAGETARDNDDDRRAEIVVWAAMACLKNLALEPTNKESLEAAMRCACFVKDSTDWLEESKAQGFLYFMRRQEDSCWIREDDTVLCVDGNFLDEGLFHCNDYEEATEEDCENAVDIFTGATASDVCCDCGGGEIYELGEEFNDEL